MLRVMRHSHAWTVAAVRPFGFLTLLLFWCTGPAIREAGAQQVRLPTAKGGVVEISADGPQKKQGDLFIVDDNVEIHYGEMRLRADHVEYNEKSFESLAKGHVHFDYENQHLDADEAHYNASTGHGLFRNVRGTIIIERRANPNVLVSDNPLYFNAREVERFPGDLYLIHDTWITICNPERPTWQFYAAHARVRLNKSVALVHANFRVFRVPLIWLPYATTPAGRRIRQSGFLIPDVGDSSRKGFSFGEAFYWAPTTWMDATLGAQYLSRRGVAEHGDFRAKPFEDTSISYSYFGVEDRGLRDASGVRQPQGGEQQRLEIQSLLTGGWRFVTDYNQLSSLTFRLAFADTYGEAINSEVRSAVFLTNNFRGFSLNVAALNDKSFLTLNPPTSVSFRNLPEARFSSVEQAPWRKLPLYFAFESFAGALHRSDNEISTPLSVARTEFAPRVSVPIHFGPWLGITTSAAFRGTRYGASLNADGDVLRKSITRNTGEFTVDLRPPALERFYDRAKSKRRYKHTIEPAFAYRYVTGVNNFGSFIRFDADSTLTDTNEVEYGIIQRLFVKDGSKQARELMSWRVVQKHYFDPTFGGAIVPEQRNVFMALNSITPFAFALGPVHWSPIVSDFVVTPNPKYDAEQILEYDPTLEKITVIGTLLKVRPYRKFYATAAHFRFQADPILQPLSNEVRALFGYGSLNGKGFSAAGGISYDLANNLLQNQLVQASYNGSCCGIALEYRRIALGQVRTENQFRISFIIANIGTFGNLRRQERIF